MEAFAEYIALLPEKTNEPVPVPVTRELEGRVELAREVNGALVEFIEIVELNFELVEAGVVTPVVRPLEGLYVLVELAEKTGVEPLA